MSAHFAPLIFLCRMAVYAAALLVLGTARLPDPPSTEGAALMRRIADPAPAPDSSPSSRGLNLRLTIGAVLLIGVIIEARRPPWR